MGIRVKKINETEIEIDIIHDQYFINMPKASVCDGCPNNPKNGGSGVCLCTLPYLNGEGPQWTVSC